MGARYRPRLLSPERWTGGDRGGEDVGSNEWEWVHLLDGGQRGELLELERAKRAIDSKTVAENLATLSMMGKRTRYSLFRTGGDGGGGGAGGGAIAAAAEYGGGGELFQESLEVDPSLLVKLLPGPGARNQSLSRWPVNITFRNTCMKIRCSLVFMSLELCMAFVGCILYVVETYYGCCPLLTWARVCEWCYFAVVLFLAVVHSWTSISALGWEGFTDLLCLLPTIVLEATQDLNLGFLRFAKLIYTGLDVSERSPAPLLKSIAGAVGSSLLLGGFSRTEAEWRQYTSVPVAFVSSLCLMAGILYTLEFRYPESFSGVEESEVSFGNFIYFAFITLLTIGFGDIAPASAPAKAATVLCWLGVFCLIPAALSAWRKETRVGGEVYGISIPGSMDRNVKEQHVVLCGTVTYDNLAATLRETFHGDRGDQIKWIRVVVLSSRSPTPDILALLDCPAYRDRVCYMVGNALNFLDLERVRMQEAAAVIFLVDKLARNERLEDMSVMMQALSALNHVQAQRRQGHGPKLLVGLLLPTSALHLRTTGMRSVISSIHLKLSILAQSCRCPGWSAVVANLVQSHTKLSPQVLEAGLWLAEYYIGATKTFYSIPFSPFFVGMQFSHVAAIAFQRFELIVAAVEKASGKVLLNPGLEYRVGSSDRAFVLAESQEDAQAVWYFMGTERENVEKQEVELLGSLAENRAAMRSPREFVRSMKYGRLLASCKAKLKPGVAPKEEVARVIEEKLMAALAPLAHMSSVSSTQVGRLRRRSSPSSEDFSVWERLAELGMGLGCESKPPARRSSKMSTAITAPSGAMETAPAITRGKVMGVCVESEDDEISEASCESVITPAPCGAHQDHNFEPMARIGEAVRLSDPAAMSSEQAKAFLMDLQAQAMTAGEQSRPSSSSNHLDESPGEDLPREVASVEHLSNHIVILGFPPHTSFLECFMGSFAGIFQSPIVFMSPATDLLLYAMKRLKRMKNDAIPPRGVYLLRGSPLSYQDLQRAGLATVSTVILLSNPSRGSFLGSQTFSGDSIPLVDGEALLSFIKMSDGLLRPGANCIVELAYESSLRFLHTSSEIKALRALSTLGTENSFLWPKFASGQVYCSGMLDTLLSQAFYRPSRIALIEQLLLSETLSGSAAKEGEWPQLQQIDVPACLVGHSFGELFQQLIAPPLCTLAFGLYRSEGYRGAPEPYVYTGPRADSVLHKNDKVFILLPPSSRARK